MEPSSNPYAPPTAPLNGASPAGTAPLQLVGPGTRFLHLLMDGAVISVAQAAFGLVLVAVYGEKGARFVQSGGSSTLLGIGICFIYYTLMEYAFGFTLGKLVTGTRVVNEAGQRPTFGQILGRSLLRHFPFEVFTFFDAESRGWHDSLSHTYVVKQRGV